MPIDPMKLRLARNARGLTTRGLAELAHTHAPNVTRIEQGRHTNATLATVERLARALGVRTEDLLTEETTR